MNLISRPRAGDTVGVTVVDRLHTAGIVLSLTTVDEPCPLCRCRFGSHLARVPAAAMPDNRLDRIGWIGWIECNSCDQGSGTWGVRFQRLN